MYVISHFNLSNLRPEGLAILLNGPQIRKSVVRSFLYYKISTHLKGRYLE